MCGVTNAEIGKRVRRKDIVTAACSVQWKWARPFDKNGPAQMGAGYINVGTEEWAEGEMGGRRPYRQTRSVD